MTSHFVRYSMIHKDFWTFYSQFWEENCETCPYSSHSYREIVDDNGWCLFDLLEREGKKRAQIYIGIDYHKHQKGPKCLVKIAMEKKTK